MKIETILVPTDFSDHADKAFATAIELARVFGSRIELLHAYDFGRWVTLDEATFSESLSHDLRRAAENKLESLVEHANTEGLDVSTRADFGIPSQVITERARETSADLIVMGSRGLGAVKRLFLGSVTARTLQTSPCPVFTVVDDHEASD